ncbi:MAG: OprD family outer membrane porin, partial [Rhodanobacteraceae bacterium]
MNVLTHAGSQLPLQVAHIALGLMLVFGGISAASGQQQAQQEDQQEIASSTEQGATDIDQTDLSGPQPDGVVTSSEETAPFWRDSRFSAQLRTFYFDRDKYDSTSSEAWTLGGSFTYRSGYLADFLRFGATAYTSQPLYAPDDKDGTGLL